MIEYETYDKAAIDARLNAKANAAALGAKADKSALESLAEKVYSLSDSSPSPTAGFQIDSDGTPYIVTN